LKWFNVIGVLLLGASAVLNSGALRWLSVVLLLAFLVAAVMNNLGAADAMAKELASTPSTGLSRSEARAKSAEMLKFAAVTQAVLLVAGVVLLGIGIFA
jgi:hypothetical protein